MRPAVASFRARAVQFVVLPLWLGVVALSAHGESAPPTKSQTITVLAAASLTASFQAMAAAFEKSHPAVKLQLSFAGSQTLVQQIQQGVAADVFAAADEASMQKLAESGEVAGVAQLFARNKLQIVVPAGNPKHIAALADLGKPGLTIALCGPTVPCGRYATAAFDKAGVPVPAASQELDVKAVVSKVAMGEADGGIAYLTDVRAAGSTVEGVDIAAPANVIARYPIAVLKSALNPAAGAEFVAFVLSADGQQILGTLGFLPQ
jgi:molybdate transport system substrate-binding protein